MSSEVMKDFKIIAATAGTGGFSLVDGLKEEFDPDNITAIPGVTDDGGHSGKMRNELGVLPPGDSRRLLIAFAPDHIQSLLNRVLSYRIPKKSTSNGRLAEENVGNLLLSAMMLDFGTHDEAIKQLMKLLGIKGNILSVSQEKATLMAELGSGRLLKGETKIDLRYKEKDFDPTDPIKRIYLDKPVNLSTAVSQVMTEADAGILAMGDLYSSILPHFLVKGFSDRFKKFPVKIYCVNLMTKPGETDGYRASDFLKTVMDYSGDPPVIFDYVIINKNSIPEDILNVYRESGQFPVEADVEKCQEIMPNAEFIVAPVAKVISEEMLVRHDSRELARLIRGCLDKTTRSHLS